MSSAIKSWPRRKLEDAIRRAFTKAYQTIKVNPSSYLEHLRIAYNLPALTYDGVYSVDPELLDRIAEDTIRAHMRIAAAEGAGLGHGWLVHHVARSRHPGGDHAAHDPEA